MSVRVLATRLRVPWGLAFLPDGSALIGERVTGRILRLPPTGGQPRVVMRLSGVDTNAGEGGLLGLAVSPRYARDRLVYAYYTSSRDNRIVRFRLGGRVHAILTGIPRSTYHNGGRIAFGPDGMLYAGTGDAGLRENAQSRSSLSGKILRVRPNGTVPPGNPFRRSRVYTLGHRNVQGLAWDRAGRLWATEFGQNRLDEVNRIRAGRNYGWPAVEGRGSTRGGRYTNPAVTWPVSQASPSGAAVLRNGLYVAALRGERLWRVPLLRRGVGTPRALLINRYGRLRTVAAAPDGSLWVTTSNRDGRGDPHPDDDRILRLELG
ncbi:MAG: PQQ-dependent sugar dehydrogenase [Thermoleophilia bacterium]|nr:PQQ-dependent sugar dehydrogenase [Thermoleophilia bacterium]